MKTLPKIAQELGVPIATLRYRIKLYQDFIQWTTTSKGKEYDEQAEGIIKEINDCFIKELSTEEIMTLLASKYARDIEIVAETTTTTTSEQQPLLMAILQMNESLVNVISRLDRQQEMQEQIDSIKSEVAGLSRVEKNKKKWWQIF